MIENSEVETGWVAHAGNWRAMKKKDYCGKRGLDVLEHVIYRLDFLKIMIHFLKYGNYYEDATWKLNSFKILVLTKTFSWLRDEFLHTVLLSRIVMIFFFFLNRIQGKATALNSLKNGLLGWWENGEK